MELKPVTDKRPTSEELAELRRSYEKLLADISQPEPPTVIVRKSFFRWILGFLPF
jgi:hypothetical protein